MMQNIGILFMGHLLVMERLEFGIVIQNGVVKWFAVQVQTSTFVSFFGMT